MAQTWRCWYCRADGRHALLMDRLFGELRALDDVFDGFFLLPAHLVVAPPHRSLVLALQSQVSARFAAWFALVALLASKPACEASCL